MKLQELIGSFTLGIGGQPGSLRFYRMASFPSLYRSRHEVYRLSSIEYRIDRRLR